MALQEALRRLETSRATLVTYASLDKVVPNHKAVPVIVLHLL